MIGKKYDLATANCWHLVVDVLRVVYGIAAPSFRRRYSASRKARMKAANGFQIWDGWQELSGPKDGALVLMSKIGCEPDLHAGVCIHKDILPMVLHTNAPHGVVFENLTEIMALRGYTSIRFFAPL